MKKKCAESLKFIEIYGRKWDKTRKRLKHINLQKGATYQNTNKKENKKCLERGLIFSES